MSALAIKETMDDAGSAHLEQTLPKGVAGAVEANIDIVDRGIETVRNVFARFFEQICTPDHFRIFRFERWQEAI